MGRRYVPGDTGLDELCTKGGGGSTNVVGAPLPQKDAKALRRPLTLP